MHPRILTTSNYNLKPEEASENVIIYHNAKMEDGVIWAAYFQSFKCGWMPNSEGFIRFAITYKLDVDWGRDFQLKGIAKPLSYQPKELEISQKFPNFYEAQLVACNWIYTIRSMEAVQRQDIKLLLAMKVLTDALSEVDLPISSKRDHLKNAIALGTRISSFLADGVQCLEPESELLAAASHVMEWLWTDGLVLALSVGELVAAQNLLSDLKSAIARFEKRDH